MTLTGLQPPMPLDSRATSADRAHFRCSFTAILPCCSAAWPAPLPLSTFTAFLGFYCLCRSAAWPAPLPLSTLIAFLGIGDFIDFYCLCRLFLPLSLCCLAGSAAFVDFYCLSGLLLPLSTFTESVDVADFVDF